MEIIENYLQNGKAGKRILYLFIFAACLFSVWLMIKYWLGIIASDETTWEYFKATLFTIHFP